MHLKQHKHILLIGLLIAIVSVIMCFPPIQASAVMDVGDYPEVENGNINWYTWWNWSHNDLRDRIMDELETIKTSGVKANVDSQVIKDSVDVAGELETFYDTKTKSGSTEIEQTPIKFANTKIKLANEMWASVGSALKAGGDLSDSTVNSSMDKAAKYMSLGVNLNNLDANPVYSGIINSLKLAAYSIVLLFFSVNLIETTLKYEIVSTRGFISVFGRMIFSKTIIDCSALICTKILGVVKWIASQTLDFITLSNQEVLKSSYSSTQSGLWVIGKIVDFFNSITNIAPILIMSLIVLIVSMLILGKLLIRSIQLAMMTVVSPLFFACATADVTKQYFRNFITGFLQCGLQIVFMVIVYGIGYTVLNSSAINGDIFMAFSSSTMNAYRAIIVYVVMGIMIVKPPRFLTNAIN